MIKIIKKQNTSLFYFNWVLFQCWKLHRLFLTPITHRYFNGLYSKWWNNNSKWRCRPFSITWHWSWRTSRTSSVRSAWVTSSPESSESVFSISVAVDIPTNIKWEMRLCTRPMSAGAFLSFSRDHSWSRTWDTAAHNDLKSSLLHPGIGCVARLWDCCWSSTPVCLFEGGGSDIFFFVCATAASLHSSGLCRFVDLFFFWLSRLRFISTVRLLDVSVFTIIFPSALFASVLPGGC